MPTMSRLLPASMLAVCLVTASCRKAPTPAPVPPAALTVDLGSEPLASGAAVAFLESLEGLLRSAPDGLEVEILREGKGTRQRIRFQRSEDFGRHGVTLDLLVLRFRKDGIEFDGEALTTNLAEERLLRYVESARLTNSRPVVLVQAAADLSNRDLAAHLWKLSDLGMVHLLI